MSKEGHSVFKRRVSLGLLFLAGPLSVFATAPAKPNIVVVMADDMGWRDLGCYGSTFYETPHIDQLCSEGVKFISAYSSAPLCSATRAALLTGWAPARQHLNGVTPVTRSVTIKADSKSLAIGGLNVESTDKDGFTEIRATEFNLPKSFGNDKRVLLDLGKVEIMAQVTLNGKTYDTLWMPPFILDVTESLKSGQNNITVRVTSTTEGQPMMDRSVILKTVTVRKVK